LIQNTDLLYQDADFGFLSMMHASDNVLGTAPAFSQAQQCEDVIPEAAAHL